MRVAKCSAPGRGQGAPGCLRALPDAAARACPSVYSANALPGSADGQNGSGGSVAITVCDTVPAVMTRSWLDDERGHRLDDMNVPLMAARLARVGVLVDPPATEDNIIPSTHTSWVLDILTRSRLLQGLYYNQTEETQSLAPRDFAQMAYARSPRPIVWDTGMLL
jgi:hypothetical protein